MLIAALVGVDMRSTIDMDATIKSYPVTSGSIKEAFDIILAVPINDGVKMNIVKVEEIRDEAEYHGFRVSLEALMDGAKIPFEIKEADM